jgi:hypothetical protein
MSTIALATGPDARQSSAQAPAAPRLDQPLSMKQELRQAVQRRPDNGPVPRAVWERVLESLELTALAASSAQRNVDCGSAALIASCAAVAAGRASLALSDGAPQFGPAMARREAGRAPLRRVRRSCERLVGLLLAEGALAPDLIRAVLAEHRQALLGWRRELQAGHP